MNKTRKDINIRFMLQPSEFSKVADDAIDDLKNWIDVIQYYGTDDYPIVSNFLEQDGFIEMQEGIFCHETINDRNKVKEYLVIKGYKFLDEREEKKYELFKRFYKICFIT